MGCLWQQYGQLCVHRQQREPALDTVRLHGNGKPFAAINLNRMNFEWLSETKCRKKAGADAFTSLLPIAEGATRITDAKQSSQRRVFSTSIIVSMSEEKQ